MESPSDKISKQNNNSKQREKACLCARDESREEDLGDCPLKTYESNFIHREFLQFGKQHSQYKAILPTIVLSQQCCDVYVISLTF